MMTNGPTAVEKMSLLLSFYQTVVILITLWMNFIFLIIVMILFSVDATNNIFIMQSLSILLIGYYTAYLVVIHYHGATIYIVNKNAKILSLFENEKWAFEKRVLGNYLHLMVMNAAYISIGLLMIHKELYHLGIVSMIAGAIIIIYSEYILSKAYGEKPQQNINKNKIKTSKIKDVSFKSKVFTLFIYIFLYILSMCYGCVTSKNMFLEMDFLSMIAIIAAMVIFVVTSVCIFFFNELKNHLINKSSKHM